MKWELNDNAVKGSCLSMLEVECVERHEFQTPEQARACICEHLEVFYDWEGRPKSPDWIS